MAQYGSELTRRRLLTGAGAAGATILAGCASANEKENGGGLSGDISMAGSSTVFPLAEAVAERFMEEHSGVNISVSPTGTGGGFNNNFCTGSAAFNNASRKITEGEKESCAENDIVPVELRVATDALTVVVNNDANWIECVTIEELQQIWSRDGPDTWQAINEDWPDEKIERFGPASTSGTFDYFRETVLGEEYRHTDNYQPTEQDNLIVQGVQGSEFAVGYFGFSYYYNNPDSVTAIAVDSGSGCVDSSIETAKTGEYTPLSRPLFTYVSQSALSQEHVAEFARFYVEQSGNQELVADQVGYVPNDESTVEEELATLETAIENAG